MAKGLVKKVLSLGLGWEYSNNTLYGRVGKTDLKIGFIALTDNLSLLGDDKDKRIIVYCRSGNRSIKASRILEDHGFRPINVKSGIIDLINNDVKITR